MFWGASLLRAASNCVLRCGAVTSKAQPESASLLPPRMPNGGAYLFRNRNSSFAFAGFELVSPYAQYRARFGPQAAQRRHKERPTFRSPR